MMGRNLILRKGKFLSPGSGLFERAFLCKYSTESSKKGASSSSSVFRRFAENVKKETSDEELKTSVKAFEQKLTELNENESIKKAKEILSKAKEDVLRQNEAIVQDVKERAAAVKGAVGTVAGKVGSAVSTAAEPVKIIGEKIKPYVPDITESKVVKKVGEKMGEAEEKILENTNVYQYGGFKSKEQRGKAKEKFLSNHQKLTDSNEATKPTEANPEAGSSVVLHKDSKWKVNWSSLVDNNRLLQRFFGMKRAYDESNNIFVYFAREITNSISDRFSSLFAENETARAIKEIQNRDPTFNVEKFMKLCTEHVIPEILDAFLTADLPTLRVWCSEAMFNMLKANFDAQIKPGNRLDGKVLDMRNVELITAKLLDSTPVLVFSFNTQQISFMRDASGKIVEGTEDNIENVLYIAALAKEEPSPSGTVNPLTHGWKLVELAIRDKNGSW